MKLSDDRRINLPRLIETRLLVQANSGGGKSWCLRRLLEQSHGELQQLVIDPEGEFASLRERFDYVLAARHGGDTAADPRIARLLAERLLELGASAILDIYELRAHERIAFVKNFIDALVDAPKRLWHPALVVLDEAHVYCPQQGDAESAGAVIDLATRGRKRGFCLVPATQRLSKLHKDVAAECNNKLIGRTGLDVDVKRATDELGFGKDRWRELRELRPGEFFGFGPAISNEVVKIPVGPVLTTHPKAGGRIGAAAPPATAKIKALLPRLADLPAEAQERQKTVEDLKRDNASLRAELTRARREQPAAPAPKRVEIQVIHGGQIARLEKAAEKARAAATEIAAALARIQAPGPVPPARPQPLARPAPMPRRSNGEEKGDAAVGYGGLRRILIALAQRPQGLTQRQLGVRAGLSSRSGTFSTYLGRARSAGWIEGRGDLRITAEGVSALGSYDPLPEGDELLAYWLSELGQSGAARMLRALAAVYPDSMSGEDLGKAAEISARSGTFSTYLGRLRALELVEGRGELRASEELFG